MIDDISDIARHYDANVSGDHAQVREVPLSLGLGRALTYLVFAGILREGEMP